MALADLLEHGAASYVAHLLQLGYSQDQIYALVAERFAQDAPTANTIYAAINRGLAAWEAGSTLQLQHNPLRPGQLAPPQTGCLGYRYTVVLDVSDQTTGIVQTIQLTVDSASSLSYDELLGQATDDTQRIYERAQAGSRYLELHPGFDVAIAEILAAERACV